MASPFFSEKVSKILYETVVVETEVNRIFSGGKIDVILRLVESLVHY